MSNAVTFRFRGQAELKAAMQQHGEKALDSAGAALYQEAQVERLESMQRTPVKTGALRASHAVSNPQKGFNSISVTISVGGAAAPYALKVHEDLEAFHRVGQAKFLESTLRESTPYLAARVARRMRL